ncbi:MAG: alpha/beta hydrolase [Pseudomonadales bacterium]|nr:alpha/beta hydrolase [Pseudomonadales bacterium]
MNFIKVILLISSVISGHAFSQSNFSLPRTEIVEIVDSNTKRIYELHIQHPRHFSKEHKYPVVYMTDSLYTFPIVTGAARFPINFKKMEDLMFVGISWQKGHHGGLSRQRDYTPTPSSPGFKDPSGKAHEHLEFIRNDIFQYIEGKYNTDPTRRTYIGNSFGGLFGSYILLNSPESFRNYIIGSPSMWWDNDFMTKQDYKIDPSYEGAVYISVGELETKYSKGTNNDMVLGARTLFSLLKKNKPSAMDLELRVIPHANHETAFPTVAIQGLWWLFGVME